MAIVMTCSCGKTLRAKDEAAGKRTKCPHCGAIVEIPAQATAAVAAHAATAPPGPTPEATFEGIPIAEVSAVEIPTRAEPAALPPEVAPMASAAAGGIRRYKVVSQREMGFVSKFDPTKLEEVLNRYAQQGWSLKSAVIMEMPTHSGHHDEMVVILEQ